MADRDSGVLSQEELDSMVFRLLVAGQEPVTNQISTTLMALFRHPEQLARLRDGPALLPQAVESALQRECCQRAYGVIQRSRAWGDLIAHHHPASARLSIHPQPVGAAKFGIRLLDHEDAWATPWQTSVLHRPDGRRQLMRRADAEREGTLRYRDGLPGHFEARSC